MVEICALASGSNGNCYYIGNKDSAILIDMGISNRQLQKRLTDNNLSLKKIKAIFISHEHSDHIKGLRIVVNKNNIKPYITKKTYNKARTDFIPKQVNLFLPEDTICVDNIKVHSFKKQHNAAEPVSFRVEIDNINIGVITDLGVITNKIKKHMSMCNAIFLESNYDNNLLQSGRYPPHLKEHVASDYGHLSNNQAFDLIESIKNTNLKTILISHISSDNNNINLIMDKFKPLESTCKIEFTSRFNSSKVININ